MDKFENVRQYLIEITKGETRDGITLGVCPKCHNRSFIIVDAVAYCPCCCLSVSYKEIQWRGAKQETVLRMEMDNSDEKCELYKLMQEAQWLYAGWLKKSPKAREYAKERGLGDSEIKAFGIGYGGGIYDEVKGHYTEDLLLKSGLFYKDSVTGNIRERFYHRLIIPIQDIKGRIIGFGGRLTHPQKKAAKYINSPESMVFDKGANLYGMHVACHYAAKGIILCEGYMDAIALHKAGFKSAVASLGTALTLQQAKLISIFTGRVYLAYDSDGAGIKATVKAIGTLRNAGIYDIRIINLNPHKDPDEFIQKKGRGDFIKKLSSAVRAPIYMSAYYAFQCKNKKMTEIEMYGEIAKELNCVPQKIYHKVIWRNKLDEQFLQYEIAKIRSCH